jgi:hypothetical protein
MGLTVNELSTERWRPLGAIVTKSQTTGRSYRIVFLDSPHRAGGLKRELDISLGR